MYYYAIKNIVMSCLIDKFDKRTYNRKLFFLKSYTLNLRFVKKGAKAQEKHSYKKLIILINAVLLLKPNFYILNNVLTI